MGKAFFKKGVRQEVQRQGYTKLLSKIIESNLTLRQIKNGQTLFEKEVMRQKYTNPYLYNDKIKEELKEFMGLTQPKFQDYQMSNRGGGCIANDLEDSAFLSEIKDYRVKTQAELRQQQSKTQQEIITIEENSPAKTFGVRNGSMTATNALPPFSILKREKAENVKKALIFPPSPAFVNNYKNAKEPNLNETVNFCKAKNIPFQNEEEQYYKINWAKQSHQYYQNYLNKCFETNRPSEFEIGIKKLTKAQEKKKSQLMRRSSQEEEQIESSYGSNKLAFMPQIVKPAIIKKRLQSEAANTRIVFNAQNVVNEQAMKNDANRQSKFESSYSSSQYSSTRATQKISKMNQDLNMANSNYYSECRVIYDLIEDKKKKMLGELPKKINSPYREPEQKKKSLSRRQRNDPMRKILTTNKKIEKLKCNYNQKLLKILERVELDRPILMHDKLDIIWGNQTQQKNTEESQLQMQSQQQSSQLQNLNEKNLNQYEVKTALERKKLQRLIQNHKQIKAYNSLLEYFNQRVEPQSLERDKHPVKIKPHEIERMFLDTLRIIITSGYALYEKDFLDILHFLDVESYKSDLSEQEWRKVKKFFDFAAKELGLQVDSTMEEYL